MQKLLWFRSGQILPGICVCLSSVLAQAHEAKAPATMTTSGMVDMYYGYNMNTPAPSAASTTAGYNGIAAPQTPYRNFDMRSNQFSLNLIEFSFKKTHENVTGRVDLDFGDIADATHTSATGTDEVSKNIGQATITYNPAAHKNLSITMGKMATHMGWETTKSKENWQYSRSFLYSLAIPYWHSGLNVNYAAIHDKLNLGYYIYNGWNNLYDDNQTKTIGWQIAVTPMQDFTITYNGIMGPEQRQKSNGRTVHEINGVWSHGKHSVAFDLAMGSEAKAIAKTDGTMEDAKWSAFEVAFKAQVCTHFYLSPRLETYWDKQGYSSNGFTAGGQSVTLHEFTLTGGLAVTDDLETRFEYRNDMSDKEVFMKKNKATKGQATLTWGTMYTF